MSNRRVVVTGLGLVTPLGVSVDRVWDAILQGRSGVTAINRFNTINLTSKIAGMVPSEGADAFIPERTIPLKDLRKMDLFIQYGIDAAVQAIEDSGWLPQEQSDKDRTGVILGSGIGGLKMIEETSVVFHQAKNGKVSPFFIPASLINLLSGHISIKYGLTGPNHAVVTACSTGAHAIGDAARIIKYGDADVMIAGGAEAPITEVGVAGFAAARALSTRYNDAPETASRPWDADRDGFIIGEGAGAVVLEEYEHAVKRGAKIYAELVGYGLSGDGYHITAPHPEGRGAYRAMFNALKDAQVEPEEINYINAHGTSTPMGDQIELNAVERLFDGNKAKLFMSSTKSATGHLLGATGSVEFIFSILSMRDQVAPPTLNLHNPIATAIDLVPLQAKEININYVLSNSFGFGGTNASLVIKKLF